MHLTNLHIILNVSCCTVVLIICSTFSVLKLDNVVGFVSDKSPLLSEFLAQIKSSPELSSMFDSIQRDAGSTESMDTS